MAMKPTRRTFLLGGAAVGGGLLIGAGAIGYAMTRHPSRAALDKGMPGNGAFVSSWIKVSPDNKITVVIPHSDMGQGVQTSLPMMAAEEMNADWSTVGFEQAPPTDEFANWALTEGGGIHMLGMPPMLAGLLDVPLSKVMVNQLTGGSTAVRFTGVYGMRVAGAAAKEVLLQAAANEWGVPVSELTAKDSTVTHGPSGKSATYGELATAAAEVPLPSEPKLKPKSEYTIVGTRRERFDIPDKVTGKAVYGIDVEVEDMAYAAIMKSPVFGGTLKSHDASAVEGMRGIKKVVALDAGVAVIADSYWRASQALYQIEADFDANGNGGVTSETIYEQYAKALTDEPGEDDVVEGDTAAALARSDVRIMKADYKVPYLAHACMEPLNCMVHHRGDEIELWVGVQDALGMRKVAAEHAGLPLEKVTMNCKIMGGGFGRRSPLCPDFMKDAIDIAANYDKPVKMIWSRETDIQHDGYRPAVSSRFEAALDADGMPVAWWNHYIGKNEPGEAAHIPYGIANKDIRYVLSPTHVPYGPWRSVAHTQHTFFIESFIDELAHEAGKDPYEYRRALLKDKPRHLAVLDKAAKEGNWGAPLPAGHGRGIAVQESFQSVVAQVVELSIDANGKARVHKVVAAADPGEVISPDGARAQIESGIIYGLTAALFGDISIEDGAVTQTNFTDYEMVKLADSPEIDIHFVETDGAPLGGLGEPGTPPIAAAVANAVFSATGKRLRELPLKNQDLSGSIGQLASAAD